MSSWSMAWGDGSDDVDPPLPHEAWAPHQVPADAIRVARVVLHGLGLPSEPLIVAWDDQRETVRSISGDLYWYADTSRQAYPRAGEIVLEDQINHVYPRENPYMGALVVRSLEDLIETVNAQEVTRIDESGTIHIYGEHDNSGGEAVRSKDTGIILRARGVEGTVPWSFEVSATHLLASDCGLLDPADMAAPLSI